MTLNQFRQLQFPILAYLIPTKAFKNETKYYSTYGVDYGTIRVQSWYDIDSPTWSDKKKCYQTSNGRVTIRIGEEYTYFDADCTLQEVQAFLTSKIKNIK